MTLEEMMRGLGGATPSSPPVPAIMPVAPTQTPSWLQNFAASALRSGTSEMVGLPGQWAAEALGTGVEQNDAWRAANPWSSIASEILPMLLPYGAGARVVAGASRAGALGSGAARLFSQEALLARPVATTAGRAVMETAPVEALRLIATPMLGGDAERVAASAGFNLAGASLLGGGFGFLRGALSGTGALQNVERTVAGRIPDYNMTAPFQERLEALTTALPNIADPDLSKLTSNLIDELRFNVRSQNARRGDLGPLEGVPEEQMGNLSRLFRPSREGDLHVQKLMRSPREGFDTSEGWQSVARDLGLPVTPEERAASQWGNWETRLRFPRVVIAGTDAEAGRVGSNIRAHLTDVGEGWFVKREADQDLFLVAKKLNGTSAPAVGDQWFIAQTNQPDMFVPGSAALRRGDRLARFVGQAAEDAFKKAAEALPETDIARVMLNTADAMPLRIRSEKAKWDALEHLPDWVTKGAKEIASATAPITERVKNIAAPAAAQFRSAPLASWLYWMAKGTFESAEAKARTLFQGEMRADANPAKTIWKGLGAGEGLVKHLRELRDSDVPIVQRINRLVESGKPLDDAVRDAFNDVPLEVRQRVEPAVREIRKVMDSAFGEVQRHEELVGRAVTDADENYFLPHTWRGDFRVRLFDERKRLREVASGRTAGEALAEAKRVAKDSGLIVDPRGVLRADSDEDRVILKELFRGRRQATAEGFGAYEPGFTNKRLGGGIGGHQLAEGKTLTARELGEIIEKDLRDKYKYIAEMLVENQLSKKYIPEVMQRYGNATASALLKRMNDMAGRQTEFSRWQNKVMDSALGNVLGKNSASKIAQNYNAFETHFQLFVGNLGYIAANAVSFVQTVAPKLALTRSLIRRGELERAYGLYDFLPLIDKEGVKGVAAQLSPTKLMFGAMRDLSNPSEEARRMFLRAAKEGVVAPKMYDEYVGQQSRIGESVKRAMRGEEPISNLLRAAASANSFLPVRIEELSRTHAFFTGLRMAEILGAKDEARYQLAKQFTWRTMYGYAQADRPRMFTGPAGMPFGLFKNWTFHYIADWGLYAREALRGNYSGLLWATAGTGAIGGLGGLPLYALVDAAQRTFSNKPLMEELYSGLGTEAGDALFYGLPGMLGVSLQGSAAAPFNDPVRDVTYLMNVAMLDRAQKVGRLLGESYSLWSAGGENPLMLDRTWDLAAYALMPRTLYKSMAQVEDGALKSIRNGRPIIEGLTPMEQALNPIGLTPTRIARAWEASESLWADKEKRKEATTVAGEALFRGLESNDPRLMATAIGGAVERGLDVSSVIRSALERSRDQVRPQMPFDYLRQPGAVERLQALGLWE